MLIFSFGLTVYVYSRDARAELNAEFRNLKDESRLPRGLPDLVQNAQRFGDKSIYEQINSMTNSPNLDYILEEVEFKNIYIYIYIFDDVFVD